MKKKHSPLRACEVHGLCRRTLYLVDIENMACSSHLTHEDVARTQRRIHGAVEPQRGDHTVIAASHHNALATYFGWTGSAQRRARSGHDGADMALLEVIEDIEWVVSRYQRVVVASGDHIFAFAVAQLKAAGLEVIVIPPDRGLSTEMRLAAGPHLKHLGPSVPTNITQLFTRMKDAV